MYRSVKTSSTTTKGYRRWWRLLSGHTKPNTPVSLASKDSAVWSQDLSRATMLRTSVHGNVFPLLSRSGVAPNEPRIRLTQFGSPTEGVFQPSGRAVACSFRRLLTYCHLRGVFPVGFPASSASLSTVAANTLGRAPHYRALQYKHTPNCFGKAMKVRVGPQQPAEAPSVSDAVEGGQFYNTIDQRIFISRLFLHLSLSLAYEPKEN